MTALSTPAAGARRWFGLAALSLGVSMIIVDATVVNVAIPTIISDLGLQATDAEWMNTIYSLVFAALLITLGRAGDRWGRRAFFLAGVAVFVGSSLWAAAAGSPQLLIGARFVQGIGGAMILPATLSSVNAMFQGPARAVAFGVWGSVIGGMAALGPLLGGYLTTEHSWRWIFWINLPIGLVVAVAALFLVPETKDPAARPGGDLWGVVTVSAGLGAIVFALIEAQRYGWLHPTAQFSALGLTWPFSSVSIVLPALLAGGILLAAFIAIEFSRRRVARPVVVDFGLFRLRSFRNGNLAALVVSLGEFGLVFVLPLFLQSVLGYSAFRTGLVLVALAAGAFVAGGPAAALARRYGSRPVVVAGMAAEAVGLAAAIPLLSTTATGWSLAGPLFVYGAGVGLATAQLTNAILVDVPSEASGQASGIQSTFRQVGSALGIAILGTLLIVGLGTRTTAGLAAVPGLPPMAQEGIATAVRESAGAILPALREQQVPEPVIGAIEDAFVSSARAATAAAAAFIVAGVLAALRLPGREKGLPDRGTQAATYDPRSGPA